MHFANQTTHPSHLFGRAEDDALPFLGGSGGAAGAVDVHVRRAGQMVVQHEVDVGNIETASGDVGGDEDGLLSFRL